MGRLFHLFLGVGLASIIAFGVVSPALAADKTRRAAISADGAAYALLQRMGDQGVVSFHRIDDPRRKPTGGALGDHDVDRLHWKGGSHVVIRIVGMDATVRSTRGLTDMSFSRWISVDATSGDTKNFFGNEGGNDYGYYIGSAGELQATAPNDPKKLIFSRSTIERVISGPSRLSGNKEDSIVYALQQVDVASGRKKRLRMGETQTQAWFVDADGDVVARVDCDENGGVHELYTPEGRLLRKASQVASGSYKAFRVYGPAPEPGKLIVSTQMEKGPMQFRRLDIATGALGDGEFSVSAPVVETVYDPRRARVHAVVHGGGRRVRHFDADDQALQAMFERSLPGSAVLIESASVDRTRFIVKAAYADKETERYLYDASNKRFELIARG
ncbi:MAG: hypothetical protein ACFB00_09225 [Parvularculaceae bacterium]